MDIEDFKVEPLLDTRTHTLLHRAIDDFIHTSKRYAQPKRFGRKKALVRATRESEKTVINFECQYMDRQLFNKIWSFMTAYGDKHDAAPDQVGFHQLLPTNLLIITSTSGVNVVVCADEEEARSRPHISWPWLEDLAEGHWADSLSKDAARCYCVIDGLDESEPMIHRSVSPGRNLDAECRQTLVALIHDKTVSLSLTARSANNLAVLENIDDKTSIPITRAAPEKVRSHLKRRLLNIGLDVSRKGDLATNIRFETCTGDSQISQMHDFVNYACRHWIQHMSKSPAIKHDDSAAAIRSSSDWTLTMPNPVNTSTTDLAEWILLHGRVIAVSFGNYDLRNINFAAVNDPDLGPRELFSRALHLTKAFASGLESEATNQRQIVFASALGTKPISMLVVGWMVSQVNFSPPLHDKSHPTAIDRDRSRRHRTSANLKSFVLKSKSYREYKKQLLGFAHAPYEQRLSHALGGKVFGDGGRNICSKRLDRELSWVPTHLFSFSSDRGLSAADKIKACIEDTMDERWDWRPWAPRQYRLQTGFCRLRWRNPSAALRYIDVPEDRRAALQDVIKSAPAFVNRVDMHRKCSGQGGGQSPTKANGSSSTSSPSNANAGCAPGSSGSNPNQPPTQPSSGAGPNTALAPCSSASGARSNQNDSYVYLCVESSVRQFIAINCSSISTDIKFFAELKSEYDKARGWFRLWFSTWCYNRCEFWVFQRTGIELGACVKIAFPKPTDKLYDYVPKPLEEHELPPDGPISPDEFCLHYYYQPCPPLLSWERWHRWRMALSLVENEALEVAPKRRIKVDMQNGGREHFYGLYARESRSAWRVALYMVLCNLPWIVFFFLWLYPWGHGTDLQGAAVPLQLSLSLTLGYLGVLYFGSH